MDGKSTWHNWIKFHSHLDYFQKPPLGGRFTWRRPDRRFKFCKDFAAQQLFGIRLDAIADPMAREYHTLCRDEELAKLKKPLLRLDWCSPPHSIQKCNHNLEIFHIALLTIQMCRSCFCRCLCRCSQECRASLWTATGHSSQSTASSYRLKWMYLPGSSANCCSL